MSLGFGNRMVFFADLRRTTTDFNAIKRFKAENPLKYHKRRFKFKLTNQTLSKMTKIDQWNDLLEHIDGIWGEGGISRFAEYPPEFIYNIVLRSPVAFLFISQYWR